MQNKERIEKYEERFNKYPKSLFISENQILGLWVMGNNYSTRSNFYGAYPYGYLDRIFALYPKTKKTLHLFSGSIEDDDTDKVDLKYGINAETMSKSLKNNYYDLILSDPPYSVEDCEHYKCSMVKRNLVLKECYKILEKDGILVWLDQILPQYRKIEFKVIGRIGMVKSTNHRFRVITIFQKI